MLRGFVNACMPVYTSDSGAGNGGAPAGNPAGDKTNPPPKTSEDEGKNTGDGEGAKPAGESGARDEKQFSQADLEKLVERRLAEERARNERKAAELKRKADEEAAAKNGEWQTLAEQRAADLATRDAELETLRGQAKAAERYAEALNAQLEAELATWPAELLALDPGKKDLDARRAWIDKSRPLAQKLGLKPKAPATEGGKGNSNGASAPASPAATPSGDGAKFRFQSPNDVKW
jgi:colicin import membrane protein